MNKTEYKLPNNSKITLTPELNKEQSDDFIWHLKVRRPKGIRKTQKLTFNRDEITAFMLLYCSYLPIEAIDELREAVQASHDRIDEPKNSMDLDEEDLEGLV